jgi:hypothetical protein
MYGYDTERLRRTQDVLRRFWHGQPVDRPAYQIDAPGETLPHHDDEALLKAQLRNVEKHREFEDDWVPCLWPLHGGVAVHATAFGAETKQFEENGTIWACPLVADDDAERVRQIPLPAPDAGELGRVLEFVRQARTRLNGHFPFRVCDMQGPLDVAAQLWADTYLLAAMHLAPDAVHHLVDLTTTLHVEFLRLFTAAAGEWTGMHCPHVWMPPERGVGLSEDAAPLLSAQDYATFSLPYVNRIADAMGGVHVHCCGRCEHQFENFARIHHLCGLDLYPPYIDFTKAVEVFGDRVVFCLGVWLPEDPREDVRDQPGSLDYFLTHAPAETRFFFCVPAYQDDRLPRAVDKIRSWRKWVHV